MTRPVRNLDYSWARRRKFWVVCCLAVVLFSTSLWSTQYLIAALRGAPERLAAVEDVPPPSYAGGVTTDVFVSQGRLLRLDSAVDSVFIADPSIADVRVVAPDLIYVYGKKSGTTNLIATAAEDRPGAPSVDRLRASVRLRVLVDTNAPKDALRELRPDSTADLSIFGRRVVVVGKTKTVEEATDVASIAQTYSPQGQPPINTTTVEGAQQINIRVRFAEVSRSQLESLGVDWNVLVNGGNFLFGMFTGGPGSSGPPPGAAASFSSGNFDVNVFIEALQRSGVITILAEPNLTALTGETASFLAGGEIPVPVPQQNDVITVQYKQFGVALQFSPTIVKQNRISMRVKPEVSTVSTASAVKMKGFEMPSFTVRRAETTVDMASGQTFAIAGLFQREMSRDIEKFPLLGDVPVLGALFRSERYRRNETELIILITPYLVNPVSDRTVATPLDRIEPEPGLVPTPRERVSTKDSPTESTSGFIFK